MTFSSETNGAPWGAPLQPGRRGDPDRLLRLLPAHVIAGDSRAAGQLRNLLQIIGQQYSLIEADIQSMYEDLFVETCRPELLELIGSLVGFEGRLKSADTHSATARALRLYRQAELTRRLIGDLVSARRRKGSFAGLLNAVRTVAGNSAFVVESVFRIQRTADLRFPAGAAPMPADLLPSVREPRGFGSPHAWLPTLAEVRRVRHATNATPGSLHPDGVQVHLSRLQSWTVSRRSVYCVEVAADPWLFLATFHPLGGSVPLLARELEEYAVGENSGPESFAHPILRSVMAARLPQYYGPGRSLQIWYNDAPIPCSRISVDELPDRPDGTWQVPAELLLAGQVVVDPERGRLALKIGISGPGTQHKGSPPANHRAATAEASAEYLDSTPATPCVEAQWQTGLVGRIGGGYPRTIRTKTQDEHIFQVKSEADNLTAALEKFRTLPAGSRAIIELMDNTIWPWDRKELRIPPGTRLTIRASSGTLPILWCRNDRAATPDHVRFTAEGPASALVLEGICIAGRPLVLHGDLRTTLRDTTLFPGWLPADTTAGFVNPHGPSLIIQKNSAGTLIERCILGRILIAQDGLDDPHPLVLRNSILDAGHQNHWAISGSHHLADSNSNCPAWAALVMRSCTTIGRIKIHQVQLIADSLLNGRLQVSRRQLGCIRFSALPPDSDTPPRYRCQPDLAAAAGKTLPGPEWQKLQPAFGSSKPGHPGYRALRNTVSSAIRNGAEDGGEMGVFHDLDLPFRDAELIQRLQEIVPAGLDIRLFLHPDYLA